MQEQQVPMEISPEEFSLWVDHKITKQTISSLLDIKEYLKEYLASGATLEKSADVTTDRIVGRIEGLTEIFNLFTERKEDAKEQVKYGH